VVADDPSVRQRCADRLAVCLAGIDRDHLDRLSLLGWKRSQPALTRASIAAAEDLDDSPAVQI